LEFPVLPVAELMEELELERGETLFMTVMSVSVIPGGGDDKSCKK
jgi:hypothetical protein